MNIPEIPHKALVDWSAVGIAAGAWMDHLPRVAAVFSIIWLGLQIYDWVSKRIWKNKNRRKGE